MGAVLPFSLGDGQTFSECALFPWKKGRNTRERPREDMFWDEEREVLKELRRRKRRKRRERSKRSKRSKKEKQEREERKRSKKEKRERKKEKEK